MSDQGDARRLRRWSWLLLVLLSVTLHLLKVAQLLLIFVALGFYAYPAADDFCMASGVNNHGLFAYLWQHYLEWSGRYSANALYAVYPLVVDMFDGYRYIPAIVIVALFAASAYLLSTLFAVRFLSAPVLLAAAVFVCVYLLGMLSPASGLYWMAGAYTYLPLGWKAIRKADLAHVLCWPTVVLVCLSGLLLFDLLEKSGHKAQGDGQYHDQLAHRKPHPLQRTEYRFQTMGQLGRRGGESQQCGDDHCRCSSTYHGGSLPAVVPGRLLRASLVFSRRQSAVLIRSTFSTSAGYTLTPPEMNMSFARPAM